MTPSEGRKLSRSRCFRDFSGASSPDKILNTLPSVEARGKQQAFQLWLGPSSVPMASIRAPRPRPAALGRRRSGADGRAGQVGRVGTVPEHVGIGRLEELDVVLHAAIGALRLLQAILEVLEPALVATVSLRGRMRVRAKCVKCPEDPLISGCQGLSAGEWE